jgi:hypothetical protein
VDAALGIGRTATEEETTSLERHVILAESLALKAWLALAVDGNSSDEVWLAGARHLEEFCGKDASRSKAVLRAVELLVRGGEFEAARELVERAEQAMPGALGVILARAALETNFARGHVASGEPSKAAPLLERALGLRDLARSPGADLDVATAYNDAVAVARSGTRLRPEFVMKALPDPSVEISVPLSHRWAVGKDRHGNVAMLEQWDMTGSSVRFLYIDWSGTQNVKAEALFGEEILRSLFVRFESRGKMVKTALNRHVRSAQVLTFVGWDEAGVTSRIRLYYFKKPKLQQVYELLMIEPGDSPRKLDPEVRAVLDSIR